MALYMLQLGTANAAELAADRGTSSCPSGSPLLLLSVLCLSLQVNPLAEDAAGNLIAADAKLGFDDNAGYRQKDIFAMKDESQIDSR